MTKETEAALANAREAVARGDADYLQRAVVEIASTLTLGFYCPYCSTHFTDAAAAFQHDGSCPKHPAREAVEELVAFLRDDDLTPCIGHGGITAECENGNPCVEARRLALLAKYGKPEGRP